MTLPAASIGRCDVMVGLRRFSRIRSRGVRQGHPLEEEHVATSLAVPKSGNLTVAELQSLVDDKSIDTVIIAFTDMQGRLIGKRASARLFMEELAEHGAECCNYLLAVDVENEHRRRLPDLVVGARVRRHGDDPRPRHPARHPVAARHGARDGRPARGSTAPRSPQSPREILKRQIAAARRPRSRALRRHRARVHRVREHLPGCLEPQVRGPDPGQRLQHRLRAPGVDAHGAAAARHPQRDGWRGHVLRGREG